MIAPDIALATNRAGWNRVAPLFHGGTAPPEYGPLAPTEDTLGLLDPVPDSPVLELGCGSGHSLLYLAERSALELWGVDLSPVQIAFAEETLRSFASRVGLIESPMEVNPGVPRNHFDLVLSVYGLGWTTDLRATMALVNGYLRPGGCLLVSGEHPVYSCIEWNGTQYAISTPYFTEGPREYASWNGVGIVIQRRTLGTFVGEIAQAGLHIEALVETPLIDFRIIWRHFLREWVKCCMGNPAGVKRDFEALEKRRMEAIRLLEKSDLNQSEVARRLQVCRQTVSRWMEEFRAAGRNGLKKAGRAGRKAQLRAADGASLERFLVEGPEKLGYETPLWTCARVAHLIEQEFGIRYHRGHVWKVLDDLGWSCQRPVGRARERNEEQIRNWKRVHWPAIKKKPKTKGARSSSSTKAG